MKTDIALDKLVELAPIIYDLRPKLQNDEEFKSFLLSYKSKDENKPDNLDFLLKIIPLLLGKHREYVYRILSIIDGKSVEEIREQPLGSTLNNIRALWTDGEFRAFFPSVSITNEQ